MFVTKTFWIILLIAVVGFGLFMGFKKRRDGITFVSVFSFLATIGFLGLLATISVGLVAVAGENKKVATDDATETPAALEEVYDVAEDITQAGITSIGTVAPASDEGEIFFESAGEILNGRITCEASSSLGKNFGPQSILDNNEATCWQDGVKDEGLGEYFEFNFDEPSTIDYLAIRNGSWASEKKYEQNARPSEFLVYGAEDGLTYTLSLEDEFGQWQLFELHGFNNISYLKFVINGVYEGTTYKDTALSDIVFFGK